ncbi:arginine deiminase-related protein [Flammeovirgaceae bacterium SG7u.111]|nr:arginine deiminase-related protein [Flammeovirgaceae bacterium SG7u.132]WPO38684.1 arginine deiminase-related protein [Flammeovirgaceae bacterium SG7u.111]
MINSFTSHILMVRPARFGFNPQTALTNAFQDPSLKKKQEELTEKAKEEFDAFVEKLKAAGVEVNVVFDTEEPAKPDAVFPNNWISTHEDGTVILYPMCALNRRIERRRGVLELLATQYTISQEVDMSHYEEDGMYLEGTGSLILDRCNKICYACFAERTHPELLKLFEEKTGYKTIGFTSTDAHGTPVYHTNVMFSVAQHYAVVCLESIENENERQRVIESLAATGKEIIAITREQMGQFAGNVLEIGSQVGESILAMSEQAYKAFTPAQLEVINRYSKIVHSPLYTIEQAGGGSARCMIAELYLPLKTKPLQEEEEAIAS